MQPKCQADIGCVNQEVGGVGERLGKCLIYYAIPPGANMV